MNRAFNFLRAAGVIVIVAILVKLALLRIDRGADIHKPQGYERIAEIFLRHGWISVDANGKAALVPTAGEGAQGVYRRSFLLGDVEEFNSGENWIFGVENQQTVDVVDELELLGRAQHAVRLHAAQLRGADLLAVRQRGADPRERRFDARRNVARTADNLVLPAAVVDGANG